MSFLESILAPTLRNNAHLKDVIPPAWHVKVKAAHLEIITLVLVRGGGHEIFKSNCVALEVRKRQADMALTLVGGIVHCHEQPFLTRVLPGKNHKAIRGPVAFPARHTFKQLPLTISNRLPLEDPEEFIIKRTEHFVRSFQGRSD